MQKGSKSVICLIYFTHFKFGHQDAQYSLKSYQFVMIMCKYFFLFSHKHYIKGKYKCKLNMYLNYFCNEH